jgi:hypothetical protein
MNMEVKPLHTKVEKVIQVTAGMIVLESSIRYPYEESNLYLIGLDGKVIWQAERPDPNTFFTRVKLNEDGYTFSAYTLGNQACELELKSGKLISFTTFR